MRRNVGIAEVVVVSVLTMWVIFLRDSVHQLMSSSITYGDNMTSAAMQPSMGDSAHTA